MSYSTRELSVDTLGDFSKLAASQGGCWCMYYSRAGPLKRATTKAWAQANRRDKAARVKAGTTHAIIVYEGDTPVGWCQYGLAQELPRIDAGRNYKRGAPLVEGPLWRVTCFFVDRKYRGRGVSKAGLKAALASIAAQGGGTVEAYPVVSPGMLAVAEWRWFGTKHMFEEAGFRQVAKLGSSGVLMRKDVAPRPKLTG